MPCRWTAADVGSAWKILKLAACDLKMKFVRAERTLLGVNADSLNTLLKLHEYTMQTAR